MRHGQRLVREAVCGGGHVVAAHRIAFNALHFASSEVIIESPVHRTADAHAGHHLSRQRSFPATGGVRGEAAVGKAGSADEAVVVVVVPDVYGSRLFFFGHNGRKQIPCLYAMT